MSKPLFPRLEPFNPYIAVVTLVLDGGKALFRLEMTMAPEYPEEPRLSKFEIDLDGWPYMEFTGCTWANKGRAAILGKAKEILVYAKSAIQAQKGEVPEPPELGHAERNNWIKSVAMSICRTAKAHNEGCDTVCDMFDKAFSEFKTQMQHMPEVR